MLRRVLAVVALLWVALVCAPALSLAAEQTVTFSDEQLYTALKEQLSSKVTAHDDDKKKLTLDPAGVTSLTLNNLFISKINGLEAFGDLTSLNIANNAISDLTPISGLTQLTTLDAHGNTLKSLGPIPTFTQLTSLELQNNLLKDDASTGASSITSQLSSLTNLTYLDLSSNLLRYTNGLNSLSKLEHLDLYDNAVHDLSGLNGLGAYGKLTYLSLGDNNENNSATMAGLNALNGLTSLTYLDFSRNETPDIVNHVAGLTNLTHLNLMRNQLTDVSNLATLTKLKTLILAYNSKTVSGTKTYLTDLTPLFGLTQLTELNLHNAINKNSANVANMLDSSGQPVWPQLAKLDVSAVSANFGGLIDKLADLDFAGTLEVRYDYTYTSSSYQAAHFGSGQVHTDGDITYVTYDDFGARANGTYDDYGAMVNAHLFANAWLAAHPEQDYSKFEVRASKTKAYHIFNYYDTDWHEIKTNVDWHGATLVIHDEQIEHMASRSGLLFVVRTLDGGAAKDARVAMADSGKTLVGLTPSFARPSSTVNTGYKAGSKLPADIVAAFPKKSDGSTWNRYVVEFYNSDLKQHVRSGTNANSGDDQYDGVIASADGTIAHDVQWDFDHLTGVTIMPVPDKRGYLRNLNVISVGAASKSEVRYGIGGDKNLYYYRDFQLQYVANLDISGINHRLGDPSDWTKPWDEVSGSYYSLFNLKYTDDVTVKDCRLYARLSPHNRSTYDIKFDRVIDCTFLRLNDNSDICDERRWSMVGGAFGKHVTFEDCTTNRAGTHQSVYNFTIRNCELGHIVICGNGLFLCENVTCHDSYFANIRSDYGTLWHGTARLINCKLVYDGRNRPRIFDMGFDTKTVGGVKQLCEYGYTPYYPNVYVQNLTVDYALNTRHANESYCHENGPCYLVFNTTSYSNPNTVAVTDPADLVPTTYWSSDIVVNGVTFLNGEEQTRRGSDPVMRLTANKLGSIGTGTRNYLMCDVRVRAGGADRTAELFEGKMPALSGAVTVSVDRPSGAKGSFELVRIGASGAEEQKKYLTEVNGAWSTTLSEAGTYEIRVASLSDADGWQGSRTLRFSIVGGGGADSPASPVSPASPTTAASPGSPVSPVGPASPASPMSPATASSPASPVTATSPATPVTADSPATPATADPATPASPFAPLVRDGHVLPTPSDPSSGDLAALYPEDRDYWEDLGTLYGGSSLWFVYREAALRRASWVELNGDWYYVDTDGRMLVGRNILQFFGRTDTYLFNGEHDGTYGRMFTGWRYDFGTQAWYYLNRVTYPIGAARTGWNLIDGTWYHFARDGRMTVGWLLDSVYGGWFWLGEDGAMRTGWQYVNGTWYCFADDGHMLANQWVGGFYLREDGRIA